jgi:hypothetical protein
MGSMSVRPISSRHQTFRRSGGKPRTTADRPERFDPGGHRYCGIGTAGSCFPRARAVVSHRPSWGRPKWHRTQRQRRRHRRSYDRLGGVYNIATVVDDFIDRVMTDPRLNANPRVDEAHHRVSPEFTGSRAAGSRSATTRWIPDRPRPMRFATSPGSGYVFVVFER